MWGFAYLSLAPHETLPLRTNSRSFNQLEVLPARCIRSKTCQISCFLTFNCALQIPNCCEQEFASLGPTRVKLWIPHDSTKGNNQIVKAKVQSASSWPSSIMTSAQTGSPLEVQFCTSLLFDIFHILSLSDVKILIDLFGSFWELPTVRTGGSPNFSNSWDVLGTIGYPEEVGSKRRSHRFRNLACIRI